MRVLVAEWWAGTDTVWFSRPDDTEATWLSALRADSTSAELLNGIAHAYYGGHQGAQQSLSLATEWWRKAAEQGHSRAQANLASFHFEGRGVVQSDRLAFQWWRRAAEQGQASHNPAHQSSRDGENSPRHRQGYQDRGREPPG